MKQKLKQMILKLESILPMEIALSVSYEDCLIIFKGRMSGTVHFRLIKEREEPEVEVISSNNIIDFPLITPIKYADPVDEVTARKARARVDYAIMEMMQARELEELRRIARETNSDQEPTLRVA